MDFKTFASKLDVKIIVASSVSSNAYVLALHIASITYDKDTREYKCFMRNISEKSFIVTNGDQVELLRLIKLHLGQFFVDCLCNVKDEFQIPRPLLVRHPEPSYLKRGIEAIKVSGGEVTLTGGTIIDQPNTVEEAGFEV